MATNPKRMQYEINTLCYKLSLCDHHQLYTPSLHTLSYCPLCFLIFSTSRFLTPDSPLLVFTAFLYLVPQHGMTFPFLSDRDPLWTHSSQTSKHFFSQNYSHVFPFVLLFSSVSGFCLLPVLSCV